MKHLVFIFAAYLSTLTFLPCPEADACADSCAEEIHLHESSEGHQGEADLDICSPFCFCHCCQIYKLTVESSTRAFIIPSVENSALLTSDFFSKEIFSIWHPPRG
jgi:hypothetical protein